MKTLVILGAVLGALAAAGVCFLVLTSLPAPTIDGSSDSAFKTSLDAVKASLPREQHDAFEAAMAAHARAALLPQGDGGNALAGILALSADKDAPVRRLRGRIDGLTAQQIINTAKSLPAADPNFAFTGDLTEARRNANEAAAVATLKNIAAAQAQAQASGVIDRNGNGAGEYGFLTELAGVTTITNADGKTVRMQPPVLSSAFGEVEAGRVVRSGYVFQMYLPGPGGSFVAEGGKTDPDQSEVLWCCYAWPTSCGKSGQRTFFINQSGDVLASRNSVTQYSDLMNPPKPLAAFQATATNMGDWIAANGTGADGEKWVVVN